MSEPDKYDEMAEKLLPCFAYRCGPGYQVGDCPAFYRQEVAAALRKQGEEIDRIKVDNEECHKDRRHLIDASLLYKAGVEIEQKLIIEAKAEIAELKAKLAEGDHGVARVPRLVRALEVISTAIADGDGGSYWPARQFLDAADVYHDDLNDLRVLGAVAKVALAPEAKQALLLVETYGRPTGERLVISKLTRKVDALRETIDNLHDRVAGLRASNRNKASQIARLKQELAAAMKQLTVEN